MSCELVGRYQGAAEELAVAAGIATRPPEKGTRGGRPPDADALVVDSYELPRGEIELAAGELPVASVIDGNVAPEGVTVLSYHLDAAERLPAARGLLGPDFAPLDPRHAAARRPRGNRRVLVSLGGGSAGDAALATALEVIRDGAHELFVASRARGWQKAGLGDRIRWADLALSGAGSTPYELACAGVPALLIVVAGNQLQVGEAFGRAGIAVWIDGRDGVDPAELGTRWSEVQARAPELAAAGPAVLDGYGAFRAADGLLATFGGREPEPPFATGPPPAATPSDCSSGATTPTSEPRSRSGEVVSVAEHEAWLSSTLADPARTVLVVERPSVRWESCASTSRTRALRSASRSRQAVGARGSARG